MKQLHMKQKIATRWVLAATLLAGTISTACNDDNDNNWTETAPRLKFEDVAQVGGTYPVPDVDDLVRITIR